MRFIWLQSPVKFGVKIPELLPRFARLWDLFSLISCQIGNEKAKASASLRSVEGLFNFNLRSNSAWKCDSLVHHFARLRRLFGFNLRPNSEWKFESFCLLWRLLGVNLRPNSLENAISYASPRSTMRFIWFQSPAKFGVKMRELRFSLASLGHEIYLFPFPAKFRVKTRDFLPRLVQSFAKFRATFWGSQMIFEYSAIRMLQLLHICK